MSRKISLIIVGFMLFIANLVGQEQEDNIVIPKVVDIAFSKKYPAATDIYWEQEEKQYLAIFSEGETSRFATFNWDGSWVQTITAIDLEDLPNAALTYLKKQPFTEGEYRRITKVETPNLKEFFVNIETEKEFIILNFNWNGNLLIKEKELL